MIIFDMSNLVFSTMLDYHAKTKEQSDMSLIRHLILGKLIAEKKRLKEYADELVFVFDSRHYWRKDRFKYYKGNRKKGRDESSFDWNAFFVHYDEFKKEIRENFPGRYLEVHGAEADDVMAVLAMRYGPTGNVCLVTSDTDMLQIQQYICPKVKQWSLFHKKFITPKNSEYDLFEHIVRGDSGDGVPNILSQEDVLMVAGLRQKPVSSKKMIEWSRHGIEEPEKFCDSQQMLDNFIRNRDLVDLRKIPLDLQMKIVEAYDNSEIPKGRMFNYLTANRLTRILKEGGF